MNDEPLRRTALFDAHRALGARIVPFGGFEMPVQYAGILAEHETVRKRAGLFDLSHMAQFELRGADVAAWADELTVNHVLRLRGTACLIDNDPTLQRAIMLRNPYIDPMHLMQVDLLQRWRATGRRDEALFGALRATISGIAQGLQATG